MDMLTEAVSIAFQKDLDILVNKYSDSIEAGLNDQLKCKLAEVLKTKSTKI
jgi:hypothetical protein